MVEKFNPDSFAPFLESMKISPRAIWSRPYLIRTLQVLAESEEGGMDTGTLAFKTGLALDVQDSALKQLEARQLVVTGLKGGKEFVSLTEGGKNVLNAKM